ncbi:MAG: hypothetical protein NVS1B4_11770 [Gemmatimonadaceae bacterium]
MSFVCRIVTVLTGPAMEGTGETTCDPVGESPDEHAAIVADMMTPMHATSERIRARGTAVDATGAGGGT